MTASLHRAGRILRYLMEPAPKGFVQAGIVGTMRCIVITVVAFYLQKRFS